ncbi:HAD-like domain-containing protein [Cladochytrium replicatum]|nr:HAD-like domain-containing protein [Cladochytrium replicatum]
MNKRPILLFSDFDGTITDRDTGIILIDHCMGALRRRELDLQILNGESSFREAVQTMWNSVNLDWERAVDLLKDVKIDPFFGATVDFCDKNGIPVTVLSSGLVPLVSLYLDAYKERDSLKIVANDVKIHPSHWEILYIHDGNPHGHDKGLSIEMVVQQFMQNRNCEKPLVVFVGDGVSDLSAARHADLVFAKRGRDLEEWCKREGLPNVVVWDSFDTILHHLQTIK